jgi:hypothetical protein
MEFLDRIGPILGIAAFLGFSVLAFLLVVQAREVRRLREWAGRAPERAKEADELAQAAAEARAGERPGGRRTREDGWLARMVPRGRALAALGAVAAAALIAAGVLTGGFGLIGGDEPGPKRDRAARAGGGGKAGGEKKAERRPRVAVLNATAVQTDVAQLDPVSGIAAAVADAVVRPAGFKVRAEDNAPSGSEQTVVMYEEGYEEQANELAAAAEERLGEVAVEPMSQEVRERAHGAELALLVGADNADFATG